MRDPAGMHVRMLLTKSAVAEGGWVEGTRGGEGSIVCGLGGSAAVHQKHLAGMLSPMLWTLVNMLVIC